MIEFFLKVYDWAQVHKRIGITIVLMVVLLCAACITRLRFQENITDFLPVSDDYRASMQIYQEIASADRVAIQFKGGDAQTMMSASVRYGELLQFEDTLGWFSAYAPQVDYGQIEEVFAFVYEHLPYLLEEEDYIRMDSIWTNEYEEQRFDYIRQQIASMSGGFLMPMLQNDPLNLGGRVAQRLRDFQPQMNYVQMDGFVFTPDTSALLVSIKSPFGSSETSGNAMFLNRLKDASSILQSESAYSQIQVHLMGSPVIAVGNANQIKHDTWWAVAISIVLILALLLWAFRSIRAMLYIILATGFGFLFALAGISIVNQQVSLIVIGLSSVIIGIAVNYPLHMACEGSGRTSLASLVKPLLIGNVTTVGAFMTLLPLQAVALRDLGLFAALMLVGTIMFVLFVQCHFRSTGIHTVEASADSSCTGVSTQSGVTNHRFLVSVMSVCLIVLTSVFGYYSMNTGFDSDITHLNFMTPEQRQDMRALESMQGQVPGVTVYVTGTAQQIESVRMKLDSLRQSGIILDEKNPTCLIPSAEMQDKRISLWRAFWSRHDYLQFLNHARASGFSDDAFEPFQLLIEDELPILESEEFEPLTQSILTGYVGKDCYVARLTAPDANSAARIESLVPGSFDVATLNNRVVDALTDNFNYIGFACGLIVFVFLWISFRRFELAVIAFLPMAIGWIWILGLMYLLDVQFNIVNIILATFIFGQGDDYTIFITEGLLRRYRAALRYRTSQVGVLLSVRDLPELRSILLSAAIMLVGMGVLIIAKHPAMYSLAQVTIIGMFVVVLMAWIVPPIAFHLMVKYNLSFRRYLQNN